MSDDLAAWLRSQVDDDETLAESDYDIMISARKVRDAAAEIIRLRARVAELRQIIRYVAGCEHATASDEDLLEQVAAAICRMNGIDPTSHISINGSAYDWAWKHYLPQARAALEGKKDE